MGILFRHGDTLRGKAITLFYLLIICVTINGMGHGNVIPSPQLKPWALAAAFLMATLTALIVLRDKNPVSRFVRSGILKRLAILLLFIMPLSAFLGYFLVCLGIPVLYAQMTQPTGYADAYVVERWKSSGRGCHFKASIFGRSMPSKISTCIPKRDWEKLKPGDPVIISYSQSILGFVVNSIQLK